jgi:hypothetical protein
MSAFTVPEPMTALIADIVRENGGEELETGGFILAPYGNEGGTVLALTGDKGIERSWGLFQVSGLAVATLFDWADDSNLRVLAQWHSHRRQAFLSKTDLEHGFNVPGFRTAVIPNFEQPSANPTDWGWWMFEDGVWRATPAPRFNESGFEVITFEEGTVREY